MVLNLLLARYTVEKIESLRHLILLACAHTYHSIVLCTYHIDAHHVAVSFSSTNTVIATWNLHDHKVKY